MKVLRSIDELAELRGPVHVAIGVFDGVHQGHVQVIRAATEAASADGGTSVVLTFDPHPAVVLRPDKAPAVLTSARTKLRLLAECGVDAVLLHPFNLEVASCRARAFIESLMHTCNPLAQIAVGWDWTFGRNREGDTDMLQSLGEESNFTATVIEPVRDGDAVISSTAIRAALAAGNVGLAKQLLGRPHSVTATVSMGRQLGRQLGFPTANLAVEASEVLLPPNGVYAVQAQCLMPGQYGEILNGVANLGVRPTVDSENQRLLEVHLFNFSGDLYDRDLRVSFVERLRDEIKFDGLEALKSQVNTDMERAKAVLHGFNTSDCAGGVIEKSEIQ
ncbi:MAG: riboflavin kinase/FMN adenylyltransferase [Verrucomicrobiales bacterium]|jgi:riboflavin kinase/FMN adenylyltransferase